MTSEQVRTSSASTIQRFRALAEIVWTALLIGLLAWMANDERAQTTAAAEYEARAFFEQIVSTRYWNALHGGVYVPITDRTQPNPYLDLPDRDVTTTDGVRLTKVNPAYMTRMIAEIAETTQQVRFNITSLQPIRPDNRADEWEAEMLTAMGTDRQPRSEWTESPDGGHQFRYMGGLRTEASCLGCHAAQGYEVGDLRGGISVSIDGGPLLATRDRHIAYQALAFFLVWALGFVGMEGGFRRLRRELREREALIAELQKAHTDINELGQLLPICASCKKVRDDEGYWQQVEVYIGKRTEVKFSHGLCPECIGEFFPGYATDDDAAGHGTDSGAET